MRKTVHRWAPAAVLGLAAWFTVGPSGQTTLQLRAPLGDVIPNELAGYQGRDVEISAAEQEVAGMSSYAMRVYTPRDKTRTQEAAFSVYVGYYANQTQGRTIHSPKNCMPGAGWEALASSPVVVETSRGPVQVNRYLLQRGKEKAMVLYWYQGRGRVEANEYRVKWHLLRDAAIRGRSDEALVRVLVPSMSSEASALQLASEIASRIVPAVERALPRS